MSWKKIVLADSMRLEAPIRPGTKPNKTYPAGRVCERDGCGAQLSIYNSNKYCGSHGGSYEPVLLKDVMPNGTRNNGRSTKDNFKEVANVSWKTVERFAAEKSPTIPEGFRLCQPGDLCGYCADPSNEDVPVGEHAFKETPGAPFIHYLEPQPPMASRAVGDSEADDFERTEREIEKEELYSPRGDGRIDRPYI